MSAKKITTPMLAEQLAQSAGVSKKAAESFVKAFTETIIEGVGIGESVKVKDLGSFKIVKVADRASVDVNTGERIVIPGYNKLSFTPDAGITKLMSSDSDNVPVLPEVQEKPASIPEKLASVPEESAPVIEPVTVIEAVKEPKKAVKLWYVIVAVVLLVVVLAVCLWPDGDSLTNAGGGSVQDILPIDSETIARMKETHRTHILQKGESLTTISVYYYQTTDSVESICRLNGFASSSAIPVGTEVLLP